MQLAMTWASWEAMYQRIPAVQARESMWLSQVAAYGSTTKEGRDGLMAYWQRIVSGVAGEASHSLRAQFARLKAWAATKGLDL